MRPHTPAPTPSLRALITIGGSDLADAIAYLNPHTTTAQPDTPATVDHITTRDEAIAFLRAEHTITIPGCNPHQPHTITITPTPHAPVRTGPNTAWTVTAHDHDIDPDPMGTAPDTACHDAVYIAHTGRDTPTVLTHTRAFLDHLGLYSTARAWATRPDLLATMSAADTSLLILARITPTDWEPWAHHGHAPTHATPFLFAGASADQSHPWLQLGLNTYAAAERAARGEHPHYDPTDWEHHGIDHTEARCWYTQFDLTPPQAAQFIAANITPYRLNAALRRGHHSPTTVLEWVNHHIPLEDSYRWLDRNIDPATAATWTHINHPGTTHTDLHTPTTTPTTVDAWRRLGVPTHRITDALTSGHTPDNCPPDALTALTT